MIVEASLSQEAERENFQLALLWSKRVPQVNLLVRETWSEESQSTSKSEVMSESTMSEK